MKCDVCSKEVTILQDRCPNCGAPILKGENLPPKKKRGPLIAIIIIVFALAGCGAIWYGINTLSNPNNLMLTSINNLSKESANLFNSFDASFTNFVRNNERIKMDSRINLSIPSSLNLGLNELSLVINYNDYKDLDKSHFVLDLTSDSKPLINLDGAYEKDKMYFKLGDAMKQYYYTKGDYNPLLQVDQAYDYSSLLDICFEVLKEEITSANFQKSDDRLIIGTGEVKVKKYSATITKEEDYKLNEKLVSLIKGNKDALLALGSLNSYTEEETLNYLDSLLEQDETSKDEVAETLNIYVRGMNEVLLTEIVDKNKSLQFYQYDDVEKIVFDETDDEGNVTSMFTCEKEKDHYNIEYKNGEETILSGVVTPSEDGTRLELDFMNNNVVYKLDFMLKEKEITENQKYGVYFDGNVTFAVEGASVTLGIEFDTTFETIENDFDVDLNDAKDIENLSESELLQLQEELLNIPIFSLLTGLITQ